MSSKIIIPVENSAGLDSNVAQHFGRAPYFFLIEVDDLGQIVRQEMISNRAKHFGGHGDAHEFLLKEKPDIIIACSLGPRGLTSFQQAGVKILRSPGGRVAEILGQFFQGKLEPLEFGCSESLRCHRD